MFLFRDRIDAGRQLAEKLSGYANDPEVLVLGLPRGGVVLAFEIARRLGALMDVFIVRKLGVPGHEELAMGAIASGGIRSLNESVVRNLGISSPMIDKVTAQEEKELERREKLYRGGKPLTVVSGREVILVDDGLATGATMNAAVLALKEQAPSKIIVAVPVAARDTCAEFADKVDEIICLYTPEFFESVGSWYQRFTQTTDEEVQELLRKAEGGRVLDGLMPGEGEKNGIGQKIKRRGNSAA